MAIIYTYPKLTNPQGNELIVVSDVNNKNATRLITIADIASLIPGGGGGCNSAIAGILTGAGDYIPPLCNEVTFTGSGIDISADQASATITFTVPPVSIPCADAETAGTVKITDPQIPAGELTLSESGNYYAVQINEECKLGVRIPESQTYELPCATPTALGGIKAQNNVGVISVPEVAGSGTYYPIELMKDPGVVTGTDCTAIVKVPTTTISCASATTLGSIKAPKVILAAPPEIPEAGTYYSIETITETTNPDDECRAVVKIPDQTPIETEALIEQVYNSTGSIILKGTPLHINGTGPGPELNPSVDIANATNPALMPVSGLAAEDIGIAANGPMIISGLLRDVTTNTISGVTGAGDVIYASTVIGPSTPWLTGIQPSTESNLVQNVGIVSKFAGAGVGSIQVSAIGRTNATPNLDEGSIFLGDATNYSTELPIGVDNTVLTSNGTTASWQPKGMDLLFTAKYETTLTDTTNPPRFELPHLATSATRFEQITFSPTTGGIGGSGTDVYGFCSRPTNANNIIRVKVNFSVLTGAQTESDQERVMIGFHHDTTDQAGSVLDYGWQASGDREFDDLQGGDQIDQLVFYFDIPVADLITSGGLPANAGDPCYFYLKGIYDGQTGVAPIPPSVIFGRNWNVDPTTVETNNRAAGPLTIEVYEIDNNKYVINPTPL